LFIYLEALMNTKEYATQATISVLESALDDIQAARDILNTAYSTEELRQTRSMDREDDSIPQNLEMSRRQIQAAIQQAKRLASR
jgi:hypothetical protein